MRVNRRIEKEVDREKIEGGTLGIWDSNHGNASECLRFSRRGTMFINKKVGTGDAPIGFTSSRHFFTRNIIHSLSQSNSKEYLRSHG